MHIFLSSTASVSTWFNLLIMALVQTASHANENKKFHKKKNKTKKRIKNKTQESLCYCGLWFHGSIRFCFFVLLSRPASVNSTRQMSHKFDILLIHGLVKWWNVRKKIVVQLNTVNIWNKTNFILTNEV